MIPLPLATPVTVFVLHVDGTFCWKAFSPRPIPSLCQELYPMAIQAKWTWRWIRLVRLTSGEWRKQSKGMEWNQYYPYIHLFVLA